MQFRRFGAKKHPSATYNLPEIAEPADKLENLVRKAQGAQIQRRYHMLLLLKTREGKSRSGPPPRRL